MRQTDDSGNDLGGDRLGELSNFPQIAAGSQSCCIRIANKDFKPTGAKPFLVDCPFGPGIMLFLVRFEEAKRRVLSRKRLTHVSGAFLTRVVRWLDGR